MRLWLSSAVCLLAGLVGCQGVPGGPPVDVKPSAGISLGGSIPTPSPSPDPEDERTPLMGPARFSEDFEKGLDGWILTASGSDQMGWHLLEGNFCGGAFAMLLGKGGRATFTSAVGVFSLSTKSSIDLYGMKRPHLRYAVLGAANPYESVRMQPEIRIEGSDEWSPLGSVTLARYPATMTYRFADMTHVVGQPVYLRFRGDFTATEKASKGLLLDDIEVIEPTNLD